MLQRSASPPGPAHRTSSPLSRPLGVAGATAATAAVGTHPPPPSLSMSLPVGTHGDGNHSVHRAVGVHAHDAHAATASDNAAAAAAAAAEATSSAAVTTSSRSAVETKLRYAQAMASRYEGAHPVRIKEMSRREFMARAHTRPVSARARRVSVCRGGGVCVFVFALRVYPQWSGVGEASAGVGAWGCGN